MSWKYIAIIKLRVREKERTVIVNNQRNIREYTPHILIHSKFEGNLGK